METHAISTCSHCPRCTCTLGSKALVSPQQVSWLFMRAQPISPSKVGWHQPSPASSLTGREEASFFKFNSDVHKPLSTGDNQFSNTEYYGIAWVGRDLKVNPVPPPCCELTTTHQTRLPWTPSNLANTSGDGASTFLLFQL